MAARTVNHARAPVPKANLFENLGKVVDYNKKYFSTALSSMFDDRSATASHVLFSFAKYDDGEQQAAALKARIEAGEISFADAAKEFSTCPSAARGGSLGEFKKGAMVPEFDAIVVSLASNSSVCADSVDSLLCVAQFDEATPLGDGAVQGPVKTQFGHHLIQVFARSEKS